MRIKESGKKIKFDSRIPKLLDALKEKKWNFVILAVPKTFHLIFLISYFINSILIMIFFYLLNVPCLLSYDFCCFLITFPYTFNTNRKRSSLFYKHFYLLFLSKTVPLLCSASPRLLGFFTSSIWIMFFLHFIATTKNKIFLLPFNHLKTLTSNTINR